MMKMEKRHITIDKDVWTELRRLKADYELKSFSDVLRKLVKIAKEEAR